MTGQAMWRRKRIDSSPGRVKAHMKHISHSILAALATLVLSSLASAQVVHVDADLTSGANDGTSWANAYQGSAGLQAALERAPLGAEIWVTGGTYRPSDTGDRDATFLLERPGLSTILDERSILGGFIGIEQSPFERPLPGAAPATVLTGDLLGNDDGTAASEADNSYTVLTIRRSFGVVIDRVQVSGGAVEGVFFDRAFGSVLDSSIEGNHGDGIRVNSGSATMRRCRVLHNDRHGVFFQLTWSFMVELDSLLVARNGLDGVRFETVNDKNNGGAIRNCTIVENGRYGIFQGPGPGLVPVWPRTDNSILWGNGALNEFSGFGWLRSSIVENLDLPASRVSSADPRFVDAAAGDFRLLADSPAIDTGDGAQADVDGLDLDLGRRFIDAPQAVNAGVGGPMTLDLGAFEFTEDLGVIICTPAVPNSSGAPGRIAASGSLMAADNDVTLRAEQLPPNQFGIFLAGRRGGRTPMASGVGTLCMSGDIGRFIEPGQVLFSGAGEFSLTLDLTRIPRPSSFASVAAGETWHFQAWHRDNGSDTNFTDSVALSFE